MRTFAIELKNISLTSRKAHKTSNNMMATFKSMMVIGMMILGTATAFGKSSANVDKYGAHKDPHTMTVHMNCRIRHNHTKHCGNTFSVRMDRKMEKHFRDGKHKFNKHDVCKKCNLSLHEIHSVEREMGLSRPTPPPPHHSYRPQQHRPRR